MLSKAVEEVPRPFDADRSPGLLEWRTLKVSKVWHSSRTAARGEQGPELRDRLVHPPCFPEERGQVAAGPERVEVVGAENLDHLARQHDGPQEPIRPGEAGRYGQAA